MRGSAIPLELIADGGSDQAHLGERLDVQDFDKQSISRLSGLDTNRTGQVVDLGQIDFGDIIGVVRVVDLSSRPLVTFNLEDLAL